LARACPGSVNSQFPDQKTLGFDAERRPQCVESVVYDRKCVSQTRARCFPSREIAKGATIIRTTIVVFYANFVLMPFSCPESQIRHIYSTLLIWRNSSASQLEPKLPFSASSFLLRCGTVLRKTFSADLRARKIVFFPRWKSQGCTHLQDWHGR
jgi:hypothetical protein